MFCKPYKLYDSKCPEDPPPNAFNSTAKTKGECLVLKIPIGHNSLGNITSKI